MGKIILTLQMTLDGIVSDVDTWAMIGDEILEDTIAYYDDLECVVIGGRSYSSMTSYWQRAEKMSQSAMERKFAKKINDIRKIVFSRSSIELNWKNSEHMLITEENSFEYQIAKLKTSTKGNISVEAGATSWKLFLQKSLFDEMWVFIHPILLARGVTLWDFLENRVELELIDSKVYKGGIMGLYYKRTN